MSVAALLDTAEKLVQLNPCAAILATAAALENSKFVQDTEEKITAQVSGLSVMLGELVGSVVRKPPAAISSELISEVIKRTRNVLGAVKQSMSNFGAS